MMAKIIILVLLSIFSRASAQLSCFVCTNCPESDNLDLSYSQSCDLIIPPTTQTTPHTPPTGTVPYTENIDPSTITVTDTTTGVPSIPTTTSLVPSIPTTTPQVPSPPPVFNNKSIATLTGTHRCFRIGARVDGEHQVNRGCVIAANNEHATCIRANSGVTPTSCRICPFNECNGAITYTTSINVIIGAIVAMIILRQLN